MTDSNQTTETLPEGNFPPCHLCRAPPCFPLSLSSCLNLSLWSETRGGIPQVERGHPHKPREMERHLCSCLSSDPNPSALAFSGDFLELGEPGLNQHRRTAPRPSPTRHQAGNSLLSSFAEAPRAGMTPGLFLVFGAGRVLCLGDGALFWGSLLPKSLQAITASPWPPEMAGAATAAVSGLRWVEPKSPHKGRGRPRGISHVDPSPTVRSASSGGTLGRTQFCILCPGF